MVDSQKDVMSLFDSGDGLVVFKDIEELRKLISYYMDHQEEGEEIARKGREIVVNKHTYRHRIEKILSIVSEGSL